MFGPNVKSDNSGTYYHHRERRFHVLLEELEAVFAKKFGFNDYIFLFLTGSGTMANETVISSLRCTVETPFDDAEFGARLKAMAADHGRDIRQSEILCLAYPLYETSISRLNHLGAGRNDIILLDMVSAFPYWLPPEGTAFWTTVSSKQLGAYPVLGIIGIRKDLDLTKLLRDNRGSCLNLIEYLEFRQRRETRNSPAIPLYYDLLQTLRCFDRNRLIYLIDERRRIIEDLVGAENIIGQGPVVTLKDADWLESVAQQFGLYRGAAGYQVFLWSGTNQQYEMFYKFLQRAKNG